MKRLSIIFVLALVFGLMSGFATAMDFDMRISNSSPSIGETTEVEIRIDNWAGTKLKTFDFCLTYDSTIFDVESMQINDTGVGGCAAAAFSTINDNGTDCIRLGGSIFPGTTCYVADDYLLATVVFVALIEDKIDDLCVASSECGSGDGCGHDFSGYVEDDTGKQYPLRVCLGIPPILDCDHDGIEDDEDNCPYITNGHNWGTCVETIGNIVKGTGVSCTNDNQCETGDCQMNQEDCNNNCIGDVCECYADIDGDGYVYPSDLSVLLDEYGRTDCFSNPPCEADIDGDGYVYPSDLSIFLDEYGSENCPLEPECDEDGDEIPDPIDNCPGDHNHGQENSDDDELGDACDNCPYVTNPDQEDADSDEIGNVCDDCTDTDGDSYGNPGFPNNTCPTDNCPETPNGTLIGTCAKTVCGTFRYSLKPCTNDGECVGECWTCLMDQEDNYPPGGNGIGDACEWCYADFDGDGNVYPDDLAVLLGEYGRDDCLTNPCEADFDGDGYVYPSDMSIFLGDYGRTDCQVLP